MASIKDDRGFNQGFELVKSTEVRMRRRAEWMASEMQQHENATLLEIGCGTGEVSYWLAQQTKAQVLGTDLCVPFIEDARKKFVLPNLQYEVLDFNNPEQVKGRKFDYIVGNGILHHLYYKLPAALTTLHELLHQNGKIVFLEPNIYNPYCAVIFNIARNWANLEPDEMAFSKSYITRLLKGAGFGNIQVDYKDFLLPGIPDFLIQPSITVGDVLEKIPVVNKVSQSLFIRAEK
ncbi:MAG: class I SAM-dependent methyltransferase [Chitinophagales bacterium]|nr:class I SAM-dependent methyltransferase [Chitinophagales bacterium]